MSMLRRPTSSHWQAIAPLTDLRMTPQEFVERWDVTYAELGQIIGVSEDTVKHWFCRSLKSKRLPKAHHLTRLGYVNYIWLKME